MMIEKLLDLADLFKVNRSDYKTHNMFITILKEKSDALMQRRKDSKSKILQEIYRLNTLVEEIDEKIKSDRNDAKFINDEFEYMRKAKYLIAKHKNKIGYDTDEFGTFWVYGDYEAGDSNDPYHEEHFCDTWSEVLERLNTYIDQPKY
jgi:hypothetical protein